MKPLVSIIILNWNGFKDTAECLESLKDIEYSNFEIIIIDNGSREEEYKNLRKAGKGIARIIRSSKNLGFAGGANLGISHAKGKYILLLNNDTIVESNFLNPLVQTMEEDNKIGAVQAKSRYYYKREYFDYAGAAGGMIDMFGYPFARGRIFYTSEIDRGQYDKKTQIFWASGVAMMIKKQVLEKIGIFDPLYFNYFEEIDLCWRLWCEEFKIISVPEAIIYHKVAASAKRNLIKKFYLEHRNNIILLFKHYILSDLFLLLPFRILLDLVAFIYYPLVGRFKRWIGLILAWTWLIFHIPLLIKKRLEQKKKKKVKDLPIYLNSIVWQYFIAGKKSYMELVHNENLLEWKG